MYSTGVCYVLFRWDMEPVLVSGCFGARYSVAPARGKQFKEREDWCEGSRGTFLALFLTLDV